MSATANTDEPDNSLEATLAKVTAAGDKFAATRELLEGLIAARLPGTTQLYPASVAGALVSAVISLESRIAALENR